MDVSSSSSHDLWNRLEVAVRTYGQRLPVDAFWEPPEHWVEELQEARSRQRRSGLSDESGGSEEPDISFLENVEHDQAEGLDTGVDGSDDLDAQLRNQLSGGSFTAPHDREADGHKP